MIGIQIHTIFVMVISMVYDKYDAELGKKWTRNMPYTSVSQSNCDGTQLLAENLEDLKPELRRSHVHIRRTMMRSEIKNNALVCNLSQIPISDPMKPCRRHTYSGKERGLRYPRTTNGVVSMHTMHARMRTHASDSFVPHLDLAVERTDTSTDQQTKNPRITGY